MNLQTAEHSECGQGQPVYRATEDVVTRTIAGETILVPVGAMAQKLNGMATFSETGQYLWRLLAEKERTPEELAAALAKECACKPEDIREDVCAYLDKMEENGFVVRRG